MSRPPIFSLDLVLNELGFSALAPTRYDSWPWMSNFVGTLQSYMAVDPVEIKALLVTENIHTVALAQEYTIGRWCRDEYVSQDERSFFLGLTTNKPFIDSNLEGHFQGHRAIGLTICWRDQLPAVSPLSDTAWDVPHVTIDILHIFGDTFEEHPQQQIYHAAGADHVRQHVGWLRERITTIQKERRSFVQTGTELWNRRAELFPHLEFCDRVFRQVRSLRKGDESLTQIIGRLFELEYYCAGWTTRGFDADALPSKITPESEPTLQSYAAEHTFYGPDGIGRLFCWHARFTPGAGRIYFFPEEERRVIIVGHIGEHLPTVLHH
jgi:hypothetical protein